MHVLEPCSGSPWLRQRHPYEKFAFSGGLLLLCLVLPPPSPLLVLLASSVVARVAARIPFLAWLKILLIPAGFILAGVIPLLVSLTRGPSGIVLAWAPGQIIPTLHIAMRALAAAASLGLLAITTPPSEWLPLLRQARIPTVVADMMLVVYRLIFVIAAKFQSMRTAQEARLGYAGVANAFRSSGLVGANLLVFALKRSQAMEYGLSARGFGESLPDLPPEQTLSPSILLGILLLHVVLGVFTWGLRIGFV